MKVGTLTFPNSPSWGASLQMFALYKALEQLGADVEVINYSPDMVVHNRTADVSIKRKVINIVSNIFLKNPQTAFRRFEQQLKICPTEPLKTTKDISKWSEKYDRIIVGSDQVWNPYVTGNDMNFFLKFVSDNAKKASYAPSFGVDYVVEEGQKQIAELLNQIPNLSVREVTGQRMIKELTGRDVPVVLDPTFLLDKTFWKQVKKPSGAKEKYVFLFTVKKSPKLGEIARQFAEKYGYHFVYASGGLHGVIEKFDPRSHAVFGIGPAEFIDLVDRAEYVFTNSFHGTAFSINMNKNFFVEFSSDSNSRLTDIIKLLDLENCIIDADNFDFRPLEINYPEVMKKLNVEREKSMDFLKGILK